MPALKNTNAISGWSDTLATNAGKWAQNCKWEHSSVAFRTYGKDEYGNDLSWGENMAKIGSSDLTAKFPFGTLASQVDGWKSEEKDWDCTKQEYYVFFLQMDPLKMDVEKHQMLMDPFQCVDILLKLSGLPPLKLVVLLWIVP
jgi:hypothetical protein